MQPGALSARQSGLLRQQRATVAMESDCGRFRASLSSGQAVLLGAKRRGAGNIVAGYADSVAHGFLLKLSIACPSQRSSSSVHCIHGGLEWVATWLVLVYSKCCGTARDWVTATISARDSKYGFHTHILANDSGQWSIGVRRQAPQRKYSEGYGTGMHIPCCSITAHAAASNARRGSFAQRLARSSLHMRHPPRTLCRLCAMRLAGDQSSASARPPN